MFIGLQEVTFNQFVFFYDIKTEIAKITQVRLLKILVKIIAFIFRSAKDAKWRTEMLSFVNRVVLDRPKISLSVLPVLFAPTPNAKLKKMIKCQKALKFFGI